MTTKNITQQAIAAAGGPTVVAERFTREGGKPVTKGAVSQWGKNNRVPQGRVVDLCHMTRGVFQPHQLRPDYFSEGVRV